MTPPYKEKPIEKLYYSIGEVAKLFGVNSSLVRFWEKEFDIIKPKKNKKGNRMFTQKDVDNLRIIYH
jgi:DNA-binding transcriptional MerR regulator